MVRSIERHGVLYSFGLEKVGGDWANYITVAAGGGDAVRIPCRQADGVAIRYNKKSLAADGGARGVFDFLARCIDSDFALCMVYRVIDMYL